MHYPSINIIHLEETKFFVDFCIHALHKWQTQLMRLLGFLKTLIYTVNKIFTIPNPNKNVNELFIKINS
jgi:hypothetical protein